MEHGILAGTVPAAPSFEGMHRCIGQARASLAASRHSYLYRHSLDQEEAAPLGSSRTWPGVADWRSPVRPDTLCRRATPLSASAVVADTLRRATMRGANCGQGPCPGVPSLLWSARRGSEGRAWLQHLAPSGACGESVEDGITHTARRAGRPYGRPCMDGGGGGIGGCFVGSRASCLSIPGSSLTGGDAWAGRKASARDTADNQARVVTGEWA